MMAMAYSCSSKPLEKLWRFRYQRPGSSSRTNLSLGSYPALTLAAARQIRDQHLTTLAQGMDPQQQQEQASEQRQIELDSIFSTVAANWFQIKSKSVTEDYAKTFGALWIKTFSLQSVRYLFRRLKPERLLKHLSQSKHVGAGDSSPPGTAY
jgi:hypothetical protein